MKYATALEIMRIALADRASGGLFHLPHTAEIGATEMIFAYCHERSPIELPKYQAARDAAAQVIEERESFRGEDGRQYFDPGPSGRRGIDTGLPRERMRKQLGFRLIPADALAA